ncbi:uncharacterized protein LOC122840139 isoform X2 [Gambusia affinis]|uniref:uncharacterized protein LOC122840139 isoform X2 n=1 Tax=Gambusia affinis TaxID=33528 RepID=UPI001CDCEAF6|nr:uncharacterized protein LOC122840139 isoform X2 [Gambusia affinis]
MSSSDPPGNSPETCDTEKEEPCLNNISPTGGETEKDADEKAGKSADMKQTCHNEESSDKSKMIEELEHTKELPNPGPSAPSVQPQNESQPASSYWGELWPKVKIFPFPTGQTFGAHEAIMEKLRKNKVQRNLRSSLCFVQLPHALGQMWNQQ